MAGTDFELNRAANIFPLPGVPKGAEKSKPLHAEVIQAMQSHQNLLLKMIKSGNPQQQEQAAEALLASIRSLKKPRGQGLKRILNVKASPKKPRKKEGAGLPEKYIQDAFRMKALSLLQKRGYDPASHTLFERIHQIPIASTLKGDVTEMEMEVPLSGEVAKIRGAFKKNAPVTGSFTVVA